ncbi:MAG: ATP-binding protein, partial [Chloroflexota bacterium]
DDWCYLYNFRELDRPWIVSLPQGKGNAFRTQVGDLLGRLREDLSQAFASEEYKNRRKKIVEAGRGEQQQFLEKISQEAHDRGFSLQMTQMGPMLVPLSNGHPMEDTEYHGLDEAKRREIEARRTELRQEIQAGIEQLTNVERETAERLQKVDKEIGQFTVSRLFAPLVKEHAGLAKVSQYLDDLKAYTLENLDLFKATEEPVNPVFGVPTSQMMGGRDPFLPFQVNVFIDNSETKGPPVIIESNPNFGNVFGKIERRFLLGGYLSDHTMLKPGALGRANGGYLLINAPDVLANPGVWPALKRAIKGNEVRIEDPFEQFGLIAPQGMRPEPMPIKVKIILIGDAYLYQMLSMYDEDFWEIFKVKADFNTEIERTRENMLGYAAFLSGCCEECQARHFDPGGVAKVMEYSSRMVADQERLSSRFAQIREVVEEANYWTAKEGARYIGARHVQQAIDQRRFRHNLVEERLQDGINRGMVMIDVGGAVVGQVNGLSVYSLGDFSFGKPSRITAQTFLGRGGVINIERESRLSGPIFNKGVLILSGYLGWKYAQDKPLSLSASLCFEQSYEGVEGDSASSPELYAILSSLSGVPVKQNIAVTGSVNQKGEIQPIGGVNQKIEGFFRVCQARGLTGEQGVLIPHQNLRNLMLRDEVVEAVANGQFHIYSARTIDEGIEVLTGRSAGKHRQDGSYPRNTINFLVDKQLKEMADRLKGFYAEEKKGAK